MLAFIFDIDGTLVDSNELHVDSWDHAFRRFGNMIAREAEQPTPQPKEGRSEVRSQSGKNVGKTLSFEQSRRPVIEASSPLHR